MAAPTFIQEVETVWNTSTSPKTTASFNVLANDVLVTISISAHYNSGESVSDTATTIAGGSLTWTNRQTVQVNDYTWIGMWTATVDSNKAMTVSFTDNDDQLMGGQVFTFRTSDGVGASSKTNVLSGAPTLNLTTTQADSAIVVASADWNATDGASRTWRTGAGAFTEQAYFRDAAQYTLYTGYHANAGAIGTYAVGLSAPGSQKYSIAAVEIKGTADAGGGTPLIFVQKKNARMFRGMGR